MGMPDIPPEGTPDIAAIVDALQATGRIENLTETDLEPVTTRGVAHTHYRLRGRAAVVRIARLSQQGLSPDDNLIYEAESFRRAQASNVTPELYETLPVSPDLPWGGLVVAEILGGLPELPRDLPKLADALVRLHGIRDPGAGKAAPLTRQADPVADTLAVIERSSHYFGEAGLDQAVREAIEEDLGWARAFAGSHPDTPHPIRFVGTDTHPGNFLIMPDGRAAFVDLEKGGYGSPAIDLAHATLYTSTMWEPDCAAALGPEDVAAFYARYLDQANADFAEELRPWLQPMRRLTWLRTLSWCARWRVESAKPAGSDFGGGATSQWSAEKLADERATAIRSRIADYFDPETVARVRSEWTDGQRDWLTL